MMFAFGFVSFGRRALSLRWLGGVGACIALCAAFANADSLPTENQVNQVRLAFLSGKRPYPERLADWMLFDGDPLQQKPLYMMGYQLNVPLFTDYAQKRRFVWIPKGSPKIQYREKGTFLFPKGTLLVKTFLREERIQNRGSVLAVRPVETRLLLKTRRQGGWQGLVYLWKNLAAPGQAPNWQAFRAPTGAILPIYSAQSGEKSHYIVPSEDDCRQCHRRTSKRGLCDFGRQCKQADSCGSWKPSAKAARASLRRLPVWRGGPIGTTAANLHRSIANSGKEVSQLAHWVQSGYLASLPTRPVVGQVSGSPANIPCFPGWNTTNGYCGEDGKMSCLLVLKSWQMASAKARRDALWPQLARCASVYLDVNCAHCHRSGGLAASSRLSLSHRSYKLDQPSHPELCDTPLGIHKTPVTTVKGTDGIKQVVAPQEPDKSLLYFRMASLEPSVKMPPLGRQMVHREGLALIRAWILGLKKAQPVQPQQDVVALKKRKYRALWWIRKGRALRQRPRLWQGANRRHSR